MILVIAEVEAKILRTSVVGDLNSDSVCLALT